VSAPKNKEIEIRIKHKRALVGGITGKPSNEAGGTTPNFGGN
jgi:hypothetical protein